MGSTQSYFSRILLPRRRIKSLNIPSPADVVFITGCDSGLGFNLALLCHSLNMTVVAGCHAKHSEGLSVLQKYKDTNRMYPIKLDLLENDSIINAKEFIDDLISKNENYKFKALVNNAGIMCFGQFEWQTTNIIESQIKTNVLGTMETTKTFLPLVRLHKGRIINISSHCALHSLPGLSVYNASKAGLRFWNDSLRMEMYPYGVNVINFIPGSFFMTSNICSNQQKYANEMRTELNTEQWKFYGDFFTEYFEALRPISSRKTPIEMRDEILFEKFKLALLDENPKAVYIHEPLRYKLYHALFKIAPCTWIVDWLTYKFMALPQYRQKKIA